MSSVKPEIRQGVILDHLMQVGHADLSTLAELCGVSQMTIHRDLDSLDDAGLLRKVRGGATVEASSHFESNVRYRERVSASEKAAIAEAAAALIEPGMSVMLDDGSTVGAVLPHLIARAPLTVITACVGVVNVLSSTPGINTIAAGGTYSARFDAFQGPNTVSQLQQLRADIALLSSSALAGTVAYHQEEQNVAAKRAMLASATDAYLLIDPKKFGLTALHVMADVSEFTGLIVAETPPAQTVDAMKKANKSVIIAGQPS
ncbi:MAG: DeoR/GlpR family DNA-binding transcription regulator [Pseudomonadota bacterium]